MSLEHYYQARMMIDRAGGGDFEGAKSETLVAKAEAALGVVFPPSYRRFLTELGCGNVCGLEIFGIVNDEFQHSAIPNGIWLTLNERRSLGLDTAYILVGDAGDGTYYALDTSSLGRDGEAPVVHLSIDGRDAERIADDFGSYLLSAVKRAL